MHGLTGIFGTGLQSQTHVYDLILAASFPTSSGALLCLVEWYHGISGWCNTITRGCWWKIKRMGKITKGKKDFKKRGTRISFGMHLLLPCIFRSKVFGAPHTWGILRSGYDLPVFVGDLSVCSTHALNPEKRVVESLSVFLASWPPKNQFYPILFYSNSFPPLVSILRWKTPFCVERRAMCIIVRKFCRNLFTAEKGRVYTACNRIASCPNK